MTAFWTCSSCRGCSISKQTVRCEIICVMFGCRRAVHKCSWKCNSGNERSSCQQILCTCWRGMGTGWVNCCGTDSCRRSMCAFLWLLTCDICSTSAPLVDVTFYGLCCTHSDKQTVRRRFWLALLEAYISRSSILLPSLQFSKNCLICTWIVQLFGYSI